MNEKEIMRYDYDGVKLSVWLNELLDEAGILQADLARMMGANVKTISFWNTGRSFPSFSSAKMVVLTLSQVIEVENKQQWVNEKMSVYNSIREQYLKVYG